MTEEGLQELVKAVLITLDEQTRLANKDPKESGNELFLARVKGVNIEALREFAKYRPNIIIRPDKVRMFGKARGA